MSNTDSLSFAPDALVRGGLQSNGKTSLTTAGADDHLAAYRWSGPFGQPATVTYAFRTTGTVPDDGNGPFSEFTTTQMAAAEKALQAWADVANIHFTRVDDGAGYSDNASILFGNYSDGVGAGFTYFPGSRLAGSVAGDVWINGSLDYNQRPVIGDYGGQVFVHEIGHSIGLSHPGDYDASDDEDPTYAADAEYYEDSRQYTVMSYFPSSNTGADLGAFSGAPLIDDISAVQALYGANMATRTGDTVYGFHSNTGREWYSLTNAASAPLFSVWDAGGTDTLDFSGYAQNQRIDLRAGDFSDVGGYLHNVSIAYNVTIENAIGGTGADTIIGNGANNILDGGSGNDTLFGEGGNDDLRGGAGDDQLDAGSGTNVIYGGDGTDALLLPGLISDYRSATISGGYVISGNGILDMVSNIETVATRSIGAASNNASYTFATFIAQTPAPQSARQSDITGDHYSEVMWRNANGAITYWSSGTSGFQGSPFGASVDGGWKIVETFDMDGDDKADLLWRHENGTIIVWSSNGAGFTPNTYVNGVIGNDWQIAATGDFNGDHQDDLLWRYQDGSIQTWNSTGGAFAGNSYAHGSVGTSWKVDGVADFNGDGKDDIFWRNDNGTIETWLSTGPGFTQAAYQNAGVGTDWKIAGLADFNGDGRADILWRHQNGSISVWSSNGPGFNVNTYSNSSVGNDWQIADTGDYTGDGKADILWRHDNGTVQVWASTGFAFASNAFGGYASPDWSIVDHNFPL